MSFEANGRENSNVCNFLLDIHNSPSTFLKFLGLHKTGLKFIKTYVVDSLVVEAAVVETVGGAGVLRLTLKGFNSKLV